VERTAHLRAAPRPLVASGRVMTRHPTGPSGSWIDQHILTYVREPTLGPVLFVVIGHVVAFLGPALLLALRDRHALSAGVLGLCGLASAAVVVWEVRRARRPGALSAVLAVTWILSGALAVAAHRSGLF
jgi:hypothetical protein